MLEQTRGVERQTSRSHSEGNIMRTLSGVLTVATFILTPLAAQAGFVIEGSGGRAAQIAPEVDTQLGVTSFEVMPGYGLGEVLRAGIGIVFDAPEDGRDLNMRLRPTLTLDPPILPLYGRIILGMTNLLGDGGVQWEYGGAIGVGGSVAGIGLFAEIAVLPEYIKAGGETTHITLLEGRGGVMIAFD
jgi:hypothetical protein